MPVVCVTAWYFEFNRSRIVETSNGMKLNEIYFHNCRLSWWDWNDIQSAVTWWLCSVGSCSRLQNGQRLNASQMPNVKYLYVEYIALSGFLFVWVLSPLTLPIEHTALFKRCRFCCGNLSHCGLNHRRDNLSSLFFHRFFHWASARDVFQDTCCMFCSGAEKGLPHSIFHRDHDRIE